MAAPEGHDRVALELVDEAPLSMITEVIRSRYVLRIWTTSSAGSFSDKVVKPARSEKKMVTSFFLAAQVQSPGILHDLGQQRIGEVFLKAFWMNFFSRRTRW